MVARDLRSALRTARRAARSPSTTSGCCKVYVKDGQRRARNNLRSSQNQLNASSDITAPFILPHLTTTSATRDARTAASSSLQQQHHSPGQRRVRPSLSPTRRSQKLSPVHPLPETRRRIAFRACEMAAAAAAAAAATNAPVEVALQRRVAPEIGRASCRERV